jgi:hypothetical protein
MYFSDVYQSEEVTQDDVQTFTWPWTTIEMLPAY